MGARSLLVVTLGVTVSVLLGFVAAQKGYTICDVQGCNCTVPAGDWKNVNCNLHDDQELHLQPGHVSSKIREISIAGGSAIKFGPKTFTGLPAFALLRLDGVKRVTIKTRAFFTVNSSSLLVQIIGCDELVIESGAYEEMLGTLSVEITGARSVKLGQAPFSKLVNCTFEDVGKLTLEQRAFEIKNMGTATTERHGPVTVILFVNVNITEPLQEVFLTSLAQITFRDSHIGDIGPETIKSNEISSVHMIDSSFRTIMTGAFTERTLIKDFLITRCNISKLQTKAIMAAMAKLTVNHSTITDIKPNAIVSTVANVEISGNTILNFGTAGVNVSNWNKIVVDQNIISNLHRGFIEAPVSKDTEMFSFKGNDIYNLVDGSLSFVPNLSPSQLVFDDNFFNELCSCDMADRIASITNGSEYLELIMDTSFCKVDATLAKCFSLDQGLINMQNFTERTCNNDTFCEPYNGETRLINNTNGIFLEDEDTSKQTWLIVVIVIVSLFILALLTSFVALLVRGSRWLKRKGYFRSNYYNSNQSNEEEENTIVTVDIDNERLEIPQELTIEFLQKLATRLDDPATHEEATEIIERLYELYIVDDSYENNNREEEAHLYEELGNLNLQIPPPPYQEHEPEQTASTGPRGILKLMEEKIYNGTPPEGVKPTFSGEYSEPTDAAVHLYTEVKLQGQKDGAACNGGTSIPLKSLTGFGEAGPSTKL